MLGSLKCISRKHRVPIAVSRRVAIGKSPMAYLGHLAKGSPLGSPVCLPVVSDKRMCRGPRDQVQVKSRCDFGPPGVPCTTHSSVSWAPGQCVCEKRFIVERCCICQLCTQHQFMSNVVDHWSHGIRGEHFAPDDSCGRFAWNEYFGVRAHLHQKVLAGLFVVEVRWSEKTFPAMIHNASLVLLISARCTSANQRIELFAVGTSATVRTRLLRKHRPSIESIGHATVDCRARHCLRYS